MIDVKPYSLRLHLLSLISIPIMIAGCVVGGFAMWSAYHEISEVYDAQLSHAAKVLLQLTEHEVGEHESYEIELGAERPDISHRYEKNISFRIWKGDHLITESVNAIEFGGLNARPGFSDQKIDGEMWRFFVFVDDRIGITIEVAERYEIRTELIMQILTSFFMPVLFFIPLLLMLIWFGTTRSLLPLLNISAAVDERDANDLTPIDPQRIPKEVLPLIKALNRLLRRVDISLKREREFADNAAHELRTPLAAMKTQTQVLLKKDGKGADYKEGLDNLLASINRATHMVDQLLSFARLQSRDLEFEKVDLSALIQSNLKDLTPLAVAKKQDCEADVAENVIVTGNRDALTIMIRNIIDNAIKYTPAKGNINVVLQKNGTISVSDNGTGIADEDKEKVLERFTRASAKAQGSGLGLAMVKWACDLHKAELSLSDNKPKGLVVTIKMEALS